MVVGAGEPRSEVARVTAALRDQIVDGRRPQGSRLVERDLAAELGVSRVPVREALRNLVAEGLATPRPRTWTVVRCFTDADVDDLIEVRSALETASTRLAAERRGAADLDRLRTVLAQGRAAVARRDASAARRAGADFHDAVTAAAGNSLLVELADVTRSRMRWLLGQHLDLAAMVDEHAAILDAIESADAERAGRLANEHLATSRAAAIEHRSGAQDG